MAKGPTESGQGFFSERLPGFINNVTPDFLYFNKDKQYPGFLIDELTGDGDPFKYEEQKLRPEAEEIYNQYTSSATRSPEQYQKDILAGTDEPQAMLGGATGGELSLGGESDPSLKQAIKRRQEQIYGNSLNRTKREVAWKAPEEQAKALTGAANVANIHHEQRMQAYQRAYDRFMKEKESRNGVIKGLFSAVGAIVGGIYGGPGGAAAGGAGGNAVGGVVTG